MTTRAIKPFFMGLALTGLAACGGGGGSGKANVEAFDLGQPPVFADGTPVTTDDFQSQTFPIYFMGGVAGIEPGDAATLARGSGRITVSADGNTLTVQTDDLPVELVRDGGNIFSWDADGLATVFFRLDEIGAQRVLSLDDEDFEDLFDLVGTYGFRTPGSLMPDGGTATYSTNGLGRLVLTEAGAPEITVFNGFSIVTLSANFSEGTMSGTLFDGATLADVDGDGFVDDELVVELLLENSRISGGTFGGTIDGRAAAFIDEDPELLVNLAPRFSNTDVDGYFFGNDAERIGGTYEGDYRTTGSGVPTIRGSFVGYFDAGETTVPD